MNCIAPGIIYNKTSIANYGERGEEMFMRAAQNVPKKRLGQVLDGVEDGEISNDLIPQIIFNLSPGVQYTTGKKPIFYMSYVKTIRIPIFDIGIFGIFRIVFSSNSIQKRNLIFDAKDTAAPQ